VGAGRGKFGADTIGLEAGAEGISFVSGFLAVGAGRGRFGSGAVGRGAGAEGIGFISGFLAVEDLEYHRP